MDSNTLLLLGSVKLYNPETKQEKIVKAQGFDVVAMIFPVFKFISAGLWKTLAVYCLTFYFVPVWMWYAGFKFRELNLKSHLEKGWVIKSEKDVESNAIEANNVPKITEVA